MPTPNASARFLVSPGLIPEVAMRMRTSQVSGLAFHRPAVLREPGPVSHTRLLSFFGTQEFSHYFEMMHFK